MHTTLKPSSKRPNPKPGDGRWVGTWTRKIPSQKCSIRLLQFELCNAGICCQDMNPSALGGRGHYSTLVKSDRQIWLDKCHYSIRFSYFFWLSNGGIQRTTSPYRLVDGPSPSRARFVSLERGIVGPVRFCAFAWRKQDDRNGLAELKKYA